MKISVVIPTFNEAHNLEANIRHLRQSAPPSSTEIIVVDGSSTDGTFEKAQALSDKALRSPQRGRANQMQHGAAAATGELLLFLHVDTFLPHNWYALLKDLWEKEKKVCLSAFSLGFNESGLIYRVISGLANIRTRFTKVPHGDQAIAVRRKDFFEVGGFPPVPLMEEYYLCDKLKPRGEIHVLAATITTSSRRYKKKGPLFTSLRNSALVILHYLGTPAEVLVRFYR